MMMIIIIIIIKLRDSVCAKLLFYICKEIWVKLDNKHWYDHVPKLVKKSPDSKVNILWNQQVRTDRIIPNNKPDVTIRDNKQKDTRVNRFCSS